MIVYIAGPYTNGDIMENVHNAIMVADELLESGSVPFVPHLYHFWHLASSKSYDAWMALCLEWVEACDCLFRMPGESEGADREVARMEEIGRPVFYKLDELFRFCEEQTDV